MADNILQHSQVNEDVVTLVAEGRQFTCHRTKLIASSDYFRAMFSNNFTEQEKNTIELQGIDADCLLLLLRYVQSGSYVIPSGSVLVLLQTASMLQFINVQRACEQQVLTTLSCDSCLEVYYVTSTLGFSHIATAALTIAVWQFSEIRKKPLFLQLSLSELVEYISHPALNPGPGGEWTVWEALASWVEENEIERGGHLLQLLLCLDFHTLTVEDISNMLFYSIISDNNEVVQVLNGLKKFKMDNVCSKDPTSSKKFTVDSEDNIKKEGNEQQEDEEQKEAREIVEKIMKQSKRKLPQVPCVVGFRQSQSQQKKKKAKYSDDEEYHDFNLASQIRNFDMVPVIYSFDLVTKKMTEEIALTKLCNGPVRCSGYQVCSIGPSIYILGGEYHLGHGNWNKSLWRYNTASKKWIVENMLPQPRRHNMVCVVDSVIYLLGGFGRHRVVQSSMDAYDTALGDWLQCPDMPHCITYGAVCAFKGRLMVFTREMQLLTYYPSMKKWSAIPLRSPNKQGYKAALTWKNHIYLIDEFSTEVYRFSPEEDKNITRFGRFVNPPANVCVVDGKIYNFSCDDLDESNIIEILDVSEEMQDSVLDTSSVNTEISSQLRIKKNDSQQIDAVEVLAKEVWREKEADLHTSTNTMCLAEATFSLGCFPLLKLGD
ncbi:kelch-like protein 24 [Homarus americanus]|uniref:kelch-like protein 24 n=1 Tax=Homarus americanus TaxID=6706 RepID=UPI001C43B0B0|nr:kelch-like protein 24 [Homarus americanus]